MLYKSAPIVESIFEAQFSSNLEYVDSDIDSFHSLIKNDYPRKQQMLSSAFNIHLDTKHAELPKLTSTQLNGFRFFSNDDKDVIHTTPESFAYSRLKPYISWEDAYPKFSNGLDTFRTCFKNASFSRIGLRFINSWSFPAIELGGYLKIRPNIFSGHCPFLISRSTQSFLLNSPVLGLHGEVKVQLEPKKNSNSEVYLDAIFDIFVFKTLDQGIDNVDLKDLYQKLRLFKNDIFESNIENKSRELFK